MNPDQINAALELLTSTPSKSSTSADLKTSTDSTNPNSFKSVVPEALLDWRLEVSQTERYQVIQRLCQELFQSLPQEQKNDSRISQIAQHIEKKFFDSSNSKIEYFTNLKSQIFDIQRKSQNKIPNQNLQPPPSAGSTSTGSPGTLSSAVLSGDAATMGQSNQDIKNMAGSPQAKPPPPALSLSENEKKQVKERLGQISHLFPKLSGLVNTISTLGTKSDILQIHKLIHLKKAIYYQLDGLKIDRYTISPDAATGLQSTIVKYFQYGAMLIKQNQERNAQLQLLMDKNDPKVSAQLFQPSPQMQPNSASPAASPMPQKPASPYQPLVGISPKNSASLAGPTPIMPRSKQQDNNTLKINAQIKQQLFIQKINQRQAQTRQNSKTLTQQDIDDLLSENSPNTAEKHPSPRGDQLHVEIKEDDFSLYFKFEDEPSAELTPTSSKPSESPITRKRKADAENDFEAAKKIKSAHQDLDIPTESSKTVPLTLFDELADLEKQFDVKFETTDLDSLDDNLLPSSKTMTPNGTQLGSPVWKSGRTLVFCFLPNSPLRIAFRLLKLEYEEAVFDRQSRKSIIHAEHFEKFRHYGFGLEDVEVVADQSADYYDDIIKIQSFATNLGVGISGNMVQISDILRYTWDNVLKK